MQPVMQQTGMLQPTSVMQTTMQPVMQQSAGGIHLPTSVGGMHSHTTSVMQPTMQPLMQQQPAGGIYVPSSVGMHIPTSTIQTNLPMQQPGMMQQQPVSAMQPGSGLMHNSGMMQPMGAPALQVAAGAMQQPTMQQPAMQQPAMQQPAMQHLTMQQPASGMLMPPTMPVTNMPSATEIDLGTDGMQPNPHASDMNSMGIVGMGSVSVDASGGMQPSVDHTGDIMQQNSIAAPEIIN